MKRKPTFRVNCKYCGEILFLKQWQIDRVKNNFCNNSCAMKWRYANGLDKKKITQKANEAIRKNGFPQKRGKRIPQLHNLKVYRKISQSKMGVRIPKLQGKNHWNWKGGVDKGIWFTWKYKQWRKAVFERDNYTCQKCGDKKGGNLEADHIKPRHLYPELAFVVSNGQTLCVRCHKIKTKKDLEMRIKTD